MLTAVTVVLGVLTGLVLGLTGAGGSTFAVPLLMFGLGLSLPEAAPLALLAVSCAAAFGTITAWDVAYVRYRAALLMAAAGAIAAPAGLWAASRLPASALTILFALAMLLVAWRLWRQARTAPEETLIVRATVAGEGAAAGGPVCRTNRATGRLMWTAACIRRISGIGAVSGFLSGLLGVGGGFVIVPALRAWTELSMHSAIATSLMAIALTSGATAASAQFVGAGLNFGIAVPFVGGALLGMLTGRASAKRIAGPRLQSGFAVLMVLAAAALLVHSL